MARPKKITDIVLGKLREAFLLGCSDREACLYADINPDTLYEYQKLNTSYTEQKEVLKSKPVLLARRTVVEALEKDPHLALKYLERKKKDEFSLRQNLDITSGDRPLPQPIMDINPHVAIDNINVRGVTGNIDRASGV